MSVSPLLIGAHTQSADNCDQSPQAQQFEQKAIASRAELVRINGKGTDRKLAAKLLAMARADQDVRNRWITLPDAKQKQKTIIREMNKTDATLTAKLEQIVAHHGWPTIALVGMKASQAAALILVHSPDHHFQKRLLPKLQKLVREKKIDGSYVAILVDKILVAEGKPQRFGTQFSWKGDGPAVMNPVEDPKHLAQRREIYLLPPMKLYKCELAAMYHRKVQ